eukprot:4072378-Prymnesium_polylepis.1
MRRSNRGYVRGMVRRTRRIFHGSLGEWEAVPIEYAIGCKNPVIGAPAPRGPTGDARRSRAPWTGVRVRRSPHTVRD